MRNCNHEVLKHTTRPICLSRCWMEETSRTFACVGAADGPFWPCQHRTPLEAPPLH